MKAVNRYIFHSFPGLKITPLLFLSLFFWLPFSLAGQDAGGARIYRIEGRDFALTLGSVQAIVTESNIAKEAYNLERTGVIQTGAGTFLEIQLLPSGTLIKVAENTSLMYNGFDETGKFADFGLLYGRIRVVTGKAAEMNTASAGVPAAVPGTVAIRSGGISTLLGLGDFGVDYMLENNGRNSAPRPVFRLYVFRGSAEVSPYGKGGTSPGFGAAQALSLGNRESLSLDVSSSYTYAEKKSVEAGIVDYWRLHNFAGIPPVSAAPDTALNLLQDSTPGKQEELSGAVSGSAGQDQGPVQVQADTVNFPPPGEQGAADITRGSSKNTILALGLFLTVASVIVQGASYHVFDAPNSHGGRIFYNAAYVPLGLGLLTTLTGILYNPSTSGK